VRRMTRGDEIPSFLFLVAIDAMQCSDSTDGLDPRSEEWLFRWFIRCDARIANFQVRVVLGIWGS
jgi:hypothetical protein